MTTHAAPKKKNNKKKKNANKSKEPANGGNVDAKAQDHDAQLTLELPRVRRRSVAPMVPLLRAAFVTVDVREDEEGVRLAVGWSTRA